MFFVFHILVFTIYISEINNFPLNNKSRNAYDSENTDKDVDKNKSSAFRTHKPMFQIIKNLTNSRSPNLKSNIFDRMLSEEMLSIKQHIYDKEITQTTATQTFNKIIVQTPTLEVKQKWPVIELLSKFNNNIQNESVTYSDKLNTKVDDEDQPKRNYNLRENVHLKNNQSKVVELRSLPEEPSFNINDGVCQHFDSKLCTCQAPNHYTTCSYRCTESIKICTHTPNVTRLVYSPYPAFYMPYQTYLISGVSENPQRQEYYHPYVMNELKLPKKKHSKKKKQKTTTGYPDEDLYYESNSEERKHKYYDYLENDRASKKPHKNKKNDVVFNIDYDLGKDDKTESSTGRHESDDERLFKNVIDDLHSYVKKCYCSSSTKEYFLLSSFFLPLTLMHMF